MSDPRYPIGRFQLEGDVTEEMRHRWIADIESAPRLLRSAVAGLNDGQLDTPYRDGGWTLRQVAHHLPDSHINAYTRIKLALTEDKPTIKPYDEAAWSTLPDALSGPIAPSLDFLDGLHRRWVMLLRAMRPADFNREFVHPEHGKTFTIDQALGIYAWHGRHHVAHITSTRERMDW
jgi:Mycothiol maleylpyruvate isomerase N-terminal domain.